MRARKLQNSVKSFTTIIRIIILRFTYTMTTMKPFIFQMSKSMPKREEKDMEIKSLKLLKEKRVKEMSASFA